MLCLLLGAGELPKLQEMRATARDIPTCFCQTTLGIAPGALIFVKVGLRLGIDLRTRSNIGMCGLAGDAPARSLSSVLIYIQCSC